MVSMDGRADVPHPRRVQRDAPQVSQQGTANDARRRRPKDNPARPYNAPPGVKLFDVPGLLIVLGLAVAGFLVAVLLVKVGGGA